MQTLILQMLKYYLMIKNVNAIIIVNVKINREYEMTKSINI
jgi:hypothetical protein